MKLHLPPPLVALLAAALALALLLQCAPAAAAKSTGKRPPPEAELVRAAAELRVGEPGAALATLARLGELPAGGDAALVASLIRIQALLQQGNSDDAAHELRALQHRPDPALRTALALLELRVARAGGRTDRARAAAEELLALPGAPGWLQAEARWSRATALLPAATPSLRSEGLAEARTLVRDPAARPYHPAALALLASQLGQSEEAQGYLRRLLVDHGETDQGRQAAALLAPGSLPRAELRARTRNLMEARAYDLAEPDLLLLAGHAEERMEALSALALIRMRQREGYEQALAWLEEVSQGPDVERANEAWYRKGIVLGHLGRFDEAVAAMRTYLQRDGKGKFALNAGYQMGRLYHEAGRFSDAIRELNGFLAQPLRDRAMWRWFLGWAHFRAGQQAAARKVWAELVPSRNLLVGPKALYWTARSYLLEGRLEEAERTLAELQRRAPYGYYGLLGAALAARELGPGSAAKGRAAAGTEVPPPVSPLKRRPPRMPVDEAGWADLRPVEQQVQDRSVRGALRQVRLLAGAGLVELARYEAERARLAQRLTRALGRKQAAAARDRLHVVLEQFGKRWSEAGRHRLPWDEGFAAYDRAVLQQSYPAAYLPLAEAAGRLYGVSPWWLLAHMLQESRFQAASRSYVGALGPMQVMPCTGRKIAGIVGFPRSPFQDQELYEPGVALRHAAWYLSTLRRQYSGWTLLAMAAYNGGPLLLDQHVNRRLEMPGDVLIEELGPHESRNYVRKVTDHLVRYLTLYASDAERDALLSELLPPEKVPVPQQVVDF